MKYTPRHKRALREDSTSERINLYGRNDQEANYILKIDGAEYGSFEDYEDAVNAAEDARYNGEEGVEVINVATGNVVYSSDEMGLDAVLDYIDEELYDMGIRTTEEAWEYLHDWVDNNAPNDDYRPDKKTILQIADELKRKGLVESRHPRGRMLREGRRPMRRRVNEATAVVNPRIANKFMGKIEDLSRELAKYIGGDEWNSNVISRAVKALNAAIDHLEDVE